ncbi:MAG: hypothetical protein R3C39_10560 [Dehalococcoidia bacterium]
MPMQITHWHRKDAADRNDLAFAGLQVCRVWRGRDGVQSSRLFWDDWNSLVILTEASPEAFNIGPTPDPEMAKATIALSDLADRTATYTMAEAKLGHDAYKAGTGS